MLKMRGEAELLSGAQAGSLLLLSLEFTSVFLDLELGSLSLPESDEEFD